MTPIIAAVLLGVLIFCLTLFTVLSRSKKQKRDVRTPVPGINRRRSPRVPVQSEFDLVWQDSDATHRATRAKGIEISEHGGSVRSSKPIQRNSVIQVRARQIPFEGKAIVRRCQRKGLAYIIGFEMEGTEGRVVRLRA